MFDKTKQGTCKLNFVNPRKRFSKDELRKFVAMLLHANFDIQCEIEREQTMNITLTIF